MNSLQASPELSRKTRVGVWFGGQSPEHEVSVISALQAASALDGDRFVPVPVYVSKQGQWYAGNHLLELERYQDLASLVADATEVALAPGTGQTARLVPVHGPLLGRAEPVVLDVVFVAFHGGSGENGGVQGMCEMLGVPYTGSGVLSSAAGMDKVVAKTLCQLDGVPVVPWQVVAENEWRGHEDTFLKMIQDALGMPLIVKPVRLGSSIGIAKVTTAEELEAAMEDAFRYDSRALIEQCVPNLREINASVLGRGATCRVSVLEEPVAADAFLSFKDKYQRSAGKSSGMASLDRLIPAPLEAHVAERIRGLAVQAFTALDSAGVARIDFLMDAGTGDVYFNEINTIPGSFSFYLWEPAGLPFRELLSELIDLAFERFEEQQARVQSYDINLLQERAVRGLKGAKS
ncbi:MAG: D-alanine--D-alanine ligase family protein [Rhodothermales bacterium]